MELFWEYPNLYKFWKEESDEIVTKEEKSSSSATWVIILLLLGITIATGGFGIIAAVVYVAYMAIKKTFFPTASSPAGDWDKAKVNWNDKLFNSDQSSLLDWSYYDLLTTRRTVLELQKSLESKILLLPELSKSGLSPSLISEKEAFYLSAAKEVENLISSKFKKLDDIKYEFDKKVELDRERQQELQKRQKEFERSKKERKKGLQAALEARVISKEEYDAQLQSLDAGNELSKFKCKAKSALTEQPCGNFSLQGSLFCADHTCHVPGCDQPLIRSKFVEGVFSKIAPKADVLQNAFCDKHAFGQDQV